MAIYNFTQRYNFDHSITPLETAAPQLYLIDYGIFDIAADNFAGIFTSNTVIVNNSGNYTLIQHGISEQNLKDFCKLIMDRNGRVKTTLAQLLFNDYGFAAADADAKIRLCLNRCVLGAIKGLIL